MTILHGENVVLSRQKLVALITAAKEKKQTVTRLDAKQLTIPLLEQAMGSDSLFGEERVVVIEELHSLPKSKRKDELIDYVTEHAANAGAEIIFWEKRDLSATMLKKFAAAKPKIEQFKVTRALFKWLDSVTGNKQNLSSMLALLRAALESDGDVMCLVMLARQVRILLQMKEGSAVALAPFQIAKYKKQAASFSIDQLMKIHHALLEIDIAQKTSTTRLSMASELELLLVTL